MKKQIGKNNKYPEEILVWKKGESIPSWLSDVCNIIKLGENGEPILDMRKSGEGYELITSGTNQILVKVNNEEDWVCFGDKRIFSLSNKQLELLYG
jgi:hypothetical protein